MCVLSPFEYIVFRKVAKSIRNGHASDKFCRLVMIITNRLDNIYTFQVTWQGPQCHGRNCSWFILVVPFILEIVYLLIVLNPMTFTYKILEI